MVGEYLLQKNNNLDYSIAQEKIYRGLSAMRRLDTLAETIFPGGTSFGPACPDYTNLNGFFLRSDVTQELYDYWKTHGMDEWLDPDMKFTEGTFIGPGGDELNDHNMMSQDQTWNYLLGLAMVRNFVYEDETYEDYPCNFVYLRTIAKRQAERMIKFMQSYINNPYYIRRPETHNDYPGEWSGNFLDQVWRIQNPVTGLTVPAGGDIIELYPFFQHFEDAGEAITGNSMNYIELSVFRLNQLLPGAILLPGIIGFPESPLLPMPNKLVIHNNVGKLTLSTISKTINANSFAELMLNIRKYYDYYNDPLVGNPHDVKFFGLEFLPLIYILLHDESPNSTLFNYFFSRVEYLLNMAPPDQIERYEPFTEDSDYLYWSQPFCLNHPVANKIGKLSPDLYGEYNGLDYMMLFNLYHLVYDKLFNDPVIVSTDFPVSYDYNTITYSSATFFL